MTLRARAHGLEFTGVPGQFNAITDVPSVEVGYTTLIRGDDVRTGVTAILPRGRDGVFLPCAAGWYSLNGNGEMTGTTFLTETGALSLPVLVTNTHAVGTCHRGIIDWLVGAFPDLPDDWALPVVAETWDGYLNDINRAHLTTADAMRPSRPRRAGRSPRAVSAAAPAWSATASRVVTAPLHAVWVTARTRTRWVLSCRRTSGRAGNS